MLACLRMSRAPLLAVRALSTSAPLLNATTHEPSEAALRSLADLVQSAAEEQGKSSITTNIRLFLTPVSIGFFPDVNLPTTLLEKPKPIYPNQFMSPHQFAREHRITRTERRRKDPTLGPSRKHAQAIDAFRKLDIDPLDEFKNPLLLKSFVTEMGKIQSRAKTGLTWRSQRRIGKAVRRARALGFIPLWNSPQVYDGLAISRTSLPDWTDTRPTKARFR